jgi:signal transduction histidine kinase
MIRRRSQEVESGRPGRSTGGVELVLAEDAPASTERYLPYVTMCRARSDRGSDLAADVVVEERRAAARTAVAEERGRIARELHDVLAHSVSVMVVQAGAVRHRLGPELESEREALVTIERTGREALAEVRRLVEGMRSDDEPADLAPQPGLANVEKLVEQARATGLPVEVVVEGEEARLSPGVDLSVYRIVQEGLRNASSHAGSARARVVVRYGEGFVEVEVVDDGLGSATANGTGHGLLGIRERVQLYGGKLEAGPRDGGGYGLRARLPLTTGPL